jgi:Leucine-rich repeat (LRR) protein
LASLVRATTSNLRKLSLYLGAVGLFLWGLTKLQAPVEKIFGKSHPWLVIPIAGLPLAITAGFELGPAVWTQYKARRLRSSGLSFKLEISNYFRLTPYENTLEDRQSFGRADQAHTRVLGWVKSTDRPVIYLTGRSGTGKSSILNAYVIPTLRAEPRSPKSQIPIVVRSFSDPLKELGFKLLEPGVIWKDPPSLPTDNSELLSLLKQASSKRAARIVIVFDQFEEILISPYADEQLQAVRVLVGEMLASRDPNVLVLISIRSDYIGLLEQMKLPRLELGANWIEISAFNEQASRDFLSCSGLRINAGLMSDVISQARDIEETKGLIRPITLNMIGLALSTTASSEKVGVISKGGLYRLIRGYVSDSLRQSEIRPFATRVVMQMLSGRGIKRALSVSTISIAIRIPEATVTNTLLLLSVKGLVRRVDRDNNVWEVSHDFVANLFEDVIRDWRRRVLRFALPVLTPVLLALWFLLIFFFIPSWENRRLIQLVSQAQGSIQEVSGRLRVNVPDSNALPEIMRQLGRTGNVEGLDLSQTGVTDEMLAQVEKLSTLRVLNLNDTGISDVGVAHIGKLVQLQELYLRSTKISDVGLSLLSKLENLHILVVGGTAVSDAGLHSLNHFRELREVYLNYTLVSANGLLGLSASQGLQVLEVGNSRVTDDHVEQFDLFRHLHSLSLSGNGLSSSGICRAIQNLKDLGSFDADHTVADDSVATCLQQDPSLRVINLSHTNLDDRGAEQLSRITTLEEVWLKETAITDAGVTSFRGLPRLAVLSLPVTLITDKSAKDLAQIHSLRELFLGGTKISDQGIRDLSELPNLRTLFVPGCEGVTEASLEYFAAFPNLERLSLSTTHISSEGLRHLQVIRPRISVEQ